MIFAPFQCGFLCSSSSVHFVLFHSRRCVAVSLVVLFLIFCSVDADGNDVDVR